MCLLFRGDIDHKALAARLADFQSRDDYLKALEPGASDFQSVYADESNG